MTVPDLDDWFDTVDAFPRPNWGAIQGWLRVFAAESDWNGAWQQCTRHWLARLRSALGGEYTVAESEHFHLLSEHPPDPRAKALAFCEQSRAHIHKVLGEIAPRNLYGKHVVLRFTDTDDYYAYIAHFFPDGAFAESGGIFLRDGYLHIAQPQSWSPEE